MFNTHFFTRLTARIRTVELSNQHIYLRKKHATIEFPFTRLSQPIHYRRGLLFNRLIFCLAGAEQRFFLQSPLTVQQQRALITDWCYAHGEKLNSTIGKIEKILTQNYLSERRKTLIFAAIKQLPKAWLNIASSSIPAEFSHSVSTLKELISWSEHDIKEFRGAYIAFQVQRHQEFFNGLEKHPLTDAQLKACVIQEERQLLVAGAGTGKTSVLRAKLAYLLHAQHAQQHEVALLAFGNEAAKEMQERCSSIMENPPCMTFHALGKKIIKKVTSSEPKISELVADNKKLRAWLCQTLQDCVEAEPAYRKFTDGTFHPSLFNLERLADTLKVLIPLYKQNRFMQNLEAYQTFDSEFIALFEYILNAYEAYLNNEQALDFDDLLIEAIQYLESGQFEVPWKFILVDEFQDISRIRARMLRALLNESSCLFAVGDDWQSIYRFNGGDIALTTQFHEVMGKGCTTFLDKTFRFHNKILDPANEFIQKNPNQLKKSISAMRHSPRAGIIKQPYEDFSTGFDKLFRQIAQQVDTKSSVMILARTHKGLLSKEVLERYRVDYSHLDITQNTFHGAKGREAEYTILIDLSAASVPSKVKSFPLIEAMLPPLDNYQDSEERRLFYVALTRAKESCFLFYPEQQYSHFVDEVVEIQ